MNPWKRPIPKSICFPVNSTARCTIASLGGGRHRRIRGRREMYHEKPEVAQIILDSITDGVFTVDTQWHINSFNEAAERTRGSPAPGQLARRAAMSFGQASAKLSVLSDRPWNRANPWSTRPSISSTRQGEDIPISISTAVLHGNASGETWEASRPFAIRASSRSLRMEPWDRYSFADIIGRSPAMKSLFDLLPVVSPRSTRRS